MTITRIPGPYEGRSQASCHGGLVYAVATDRSGAADVSEQTRRALSALEETLRLAGTGRDRLLQVTIYLQDLDSKSEMDAVWCDWIGAAANWPQRACVGADLAGSDLVEIVVVAAQSPPSPAQS